MFKLLKRKKETHKGDYGHLFIVGGSPGLTGAVCLSAESALRAGCGLVTIGIPESLSNIIEIKTTEPMSRNLPETKKHTIGLKAVNICKEFMENNADGLLIGPGMSTETDTKKFFKKFYPQITKPIIADADALKILSENLSLLKNHENNIIITPHPGEMSSLTGLKISEIQKNREITAKEFAKKFSVIVVLKGYKTIVTDGEKIYINQTGNPGMATAGSGDVISGIIAGFIVQGFSAWDSACMGTYIHGLAGDMAENKYGEYSLIASDIIEFIHSAIKYLQRYSNSKR
ncbi:MAG: NAD(P)H-hydrate dehydratase [Candidatus Omnitrophica bacterium]|jgi:NAD(P)H-hydrate epimerase|nr:NAD(P)H-hydrate dehydratase [Candidatus Omnitrophota bacterium]